MTVEELEIYINDRINDVISKFPNSISYEQRNNFIKDNISINMTQEEIEKKKIEIDNIYEKLIERLKQQQEYLDQMSKKYNDTDYHPINISSLDISNLTFQQLEKLFFHYSWKKFLESYDKEGMKPFVGENSQGIDIEPSIFFSKGIEGVLELWDVWLKWRLNRQNNPQFKGNTPEEIKITIERFTRGNISDEERKKMYYWIDNVKNKKYLSDDGMLKRLFEYQYNEMINSYYFIMDLKEGEEFRYDQIDIKKQWAIDNSKKNNGIINPLTLFQYGNYSDFSTYVADKWNMQTIPGKDITIEQARLKRLSINGKTDVYSILKFMYEKYKKEVPLEQQVRFDILDRFIKYIEQQKSTIDLTPELIEIFNNIERDSKSSSSELIKYYSQFPEYQQMFKNIEIQSNNIKEQIRQLRLKNPQMSDNEFFEVFLNNYSKNIIDSIKKYYGDKLTPEIIERLNKFNISIINNPNAHGDMTAHPEKFQVEINVAHFGKDKKDIESKITLAMGTMPHEIFHFIFMMLKDENYCDERMVYNLSNGEQAHSFGMTGHMLNEGFVELLSSEFCRKNNIYYTISPSYIQFTKLCDYIMKTNPEINESFLMKNNYDGVLSTFSSDVIEKYKTTERMEYLRNFELETETGKKRKVEDSEVVSSYNERVKPKYMTSQVQYQQSNKQESFDHRSQNEIHTYRMIQRKNTEIKKQKRRKNKPKVLIRNLPTTSSQGNGNKGYINVIMISLITSFVLVALFVIIYIFIWR